MKLEFYSHCKVHHCKTLRLQAFDTVNNLICIIMSGYLIKSNFRGIQIKLLLNSAIVTNAGILEASLNALYCIAIKERTLLKGFQLSCI